jgi:murein DD-endopeptidase MepM/ murein hydrolase activator NlpD
MRPRASLTVGIVNIVCATTLLAGIGTAAESPAASPAASLIPCPTMTEARSPLVEPGASVVQAFGNQNAAFPDPDPAYVGRFHPGEDWAYPSDFAQAPVVAIGNGRVVATGTIGTGGQGGIVVVEHTGPVMVPASTPGAPWSYPELAVKSILTAYEGIDPSPDLMVGDCVSGDTQIGMIAAQCGPNVGAPCSDLPPGLHLEVRLAWTADPSQRSADWSVVGPATDSSAGYFFDPQVMVDDGLREPSAFLASFAAPCPDPSLAPDASVAPCPTSTPEPTPTPTPTPKPIRSPTAALLAGIPASVRHTCTPRTTGLVTGTLAAVDCHPDSSRIKLLSYFLLRPADARFTFMSRMRQYDLKSGADCHAGLPGIESKQATLSIGCFVDGNGHANLRFASRAACPGVYVGVLGTGHDIASLATAYDSSVGAPWVDPGSSLAACRSGGTGVSAPPAPSNVVFTVHYPKDPSLYRDSVPPYRLEVTWDETVDADTTIEVWAVTRCSRKATTRRPEVSCLTNKSPLPVSSRKLVASAPAADGMVSWTVPGWEVIGGPVAQDSVDSYWAIVVRAVNANGASRFVIAKGGNGVICNDCTY